MEENVVSMQFNKCYCTHADRETTIGVSYVKTTAREVKQVKPINFITFDRMAERLSLSPFLSILKHFSNGLHGAVHTVIHFIALHTPNTRASPAGWNKISIPNITNKLCDFRVIYACLLTFPLSLAYLAPYYYVCE